MRQSIENTSTNEYISNWTDKEKLGEKTQITNTGIERDDFTTNSADIKRIIVYYEQFYVKWTNSLKGRKY